MQEITIKHIWEIIKKRLIWIIVLPLLTSIAFSVYYSYVPDEFTATTSLYVLIRYEDTSGTMRYDTATSNFFASDYKELFTHSTVIEKTEEQMGLKLNQIISSINVASVASTRLVQVTVKGPSAQLCADVANTASHIFKDYIQEFMKVDSVSITKEATIPTSPSGPPRTRNTLLATLVALVAVMGVFIAIELLNTRISSEEGIEDLVSQPLLGRVPEFRKELIAYQRERANVNNLYNYIPGFVQEGVRAIALNLGYSSIDKSIRSIVVTSTSPREGKSTMSVLLASALAESGKRVLLVDTDFRNPSVGMLFKMRNRVDLMDYLAGHASFHEIVCATSIPDLYFIDSSHSTALLNRTVESESFNNFLEMLYERFDMIIFDTPPLGVFIDAAVISAKVDGAIVAIGNNKSELRDVCGALEMLQKTGANSLGVVMTMTKRAKQSTYYHYYAEERGKSGKFRFRKEIRSLEKAK